VKPVGRTADRLRDSVAGRPRPADGSGPDRSSPAVSIEQGEAHRRGGDQGEDDEKAIGAAEEQAHRKAQGQRRADCEDLIGLGPHHLVGALELGAGRSRRVGQALGGRDGSVGDIARDALGGGGEVPIAGVGAGAHR